MKISIKELKTIIEEELSTATSLGPGGPRVGSTIMALKSGTGPIMFKIMSIDPEGQTATVESEQYGHETLGIPFNDWKQFTTKDGKTIFFNDSDASWH